MIIEWNIPKNTLVDIHNLSEIHCVALTLFPFDRMFLSHHNNRIFYLFYQWHEEHKLTLGQFQEIPSSVELLLGPSNSSSLEHSNKSQSL